MPKQDNKNIVETLKSIPKIDLHRHLEGSLRLETLLKIARDFDLNLPTADKELLRPLVQILNDPPGHKIFLSKFKVLRHFYRTPEIIDQLAYEAVADAAANNVQYLELRFSPQALARVRRFPLAEVTEWVIAAVQRASQDFTIEVGLIITLVRHEPWLQAYQVAKVAFDYYGKGIVGIDLAGDEIKFPPGPFIPIFKEAKEIGLGITIHAGEWVSAYGVQQAIEDLSADRIGHGIRIIENSKILRMARERDVTFEICLTSNLQTGVVHNLRHHPLTDMMNLGLKVTINTDDPRVSDCTLTHEYKTAIQELNLGYGDLRQMTLNAANAAFLPENGRQRLLSHFANLLPEAASSGSIPLFHSLLD